MRALDVLKEQHREILGLFKRVTNGGNHGDPSGHVDQLTALLRLHTRLEETIVYPAIQRLGTKLAQEEVLESYEEHALFEYVLSQLPTMEHRGEAFLARMRVLQSLVAEHIEEEETEIFKHAENLGDLAMKQLEARLTDHIQEVHELDELLDRAARAAQRTERWAGSLLDAGLGIPRRAVGALAPSRWLRLGHRHLWAARIAGAVPRVVVDSVYRTVTGQPAGPSRSAA